jgi:hypothetical protein
MSYFEASVALAETNSRAQQIPIRIGFTQSHSSAGVGRGQWMRVGRELVGSQTHATAERRRVGRELVGRGDGSCNRSRVARTPHQIHGAAKGTREGAVEAMGIFNFDLESQRRRRLTVKTRRGNLVSLRIVNDLQDNNN